MKPVDQDRFDSPHGNCVQAAIASILELPLDMVPVLPGGDLITLNRWLKQRQLGFFWLDAEADFVPDVPFCLARGVSPRGLKHAIVCNFRGEMVHDPHPSRAGVEKILQYGYFVSLAPERVVDPAPPRI